MEKKLSCLPVFESVPKAECCGCEACSNLCPCDAIEMSPDEEGFRYPAEREHRCVRCGKCSAVCPALHPEPEKALLKQTYAGYAKDEETVRSSSSGGFFTLIAELFLKDYGPNATVSGVVWNTDFRSVSHVCTKEPQALKKMRGSKYLPSRKGKIYRELQKNLEKSEGYTLFVGCPCEITALKRFLGKEYDRLLTIDLVCKGAASEKVLSEYLDRLEKKHRSNVKALNMRYIGWKQWIPQWIRIDFANGRKEQRIFYTTDFGRGFYLMQRPACYQCRYSGDHRTSDITLGDYHGVSESAAYYNPLGTSVLIANTEKGKAFAERLKQEEICLQEADYHEVAKHNPCLIRPNQPDPKRDLFSKELICHGLQEAVRKTYPLKEKLINRLSPQTARKAYTFVQKLKHRNAEDEDR